MSKKLKFTGYSDDVFIVSGHDEYDDQIDCYGIDKVIYELRTKTESMLVVGSYMHTGCWMIGICQTDEDLPIPPWPIALSQNPDCSYSALLEIDCPNDIDVVVVEEKS